MSDLSAKLRVLAEAHGCTPGRFEACEECVERARCQDCGWVNARSFGETEPVWIPGMPCPRHGKPQA